MKYSKEIIEMQIPEINLCYENLIKRFRDVIPSDDIKTCCYKVDESLKVDSARLLIPFDILDIPEYSPFTSFRRIIVDETEKGFVKVSDEFTKTFPKVIRKTPFGSIVAKVKSLREGKFNVLYVDININSSMLGKDYWKGITLETFPKILKYIYCVFNDVFLFDDDEVILKSKMLDVDFTFDVNIESRLLLSNELFAMATKLSDVHKVYNSDWRKAGFVESISFNGMRKNATIKRPYIKVYDKRREFFGNPYKKYLRSLAGFPESEVLRIEMNIRNKSFFEEYGLFNDVISLLSVLDDDVKSRLLKMKILKFIDDYVSEKDVTFVNRSDFKLRGFDNIIMDWIVIQYNSFISDRNTYTFYDFRRYVLSLANELDAFDSHKNKGLRIRTLVDLFITGRTLDYQKVEVPKEVLYFWTRLFFNNELSSVVNCSDTDTNLSLNKLMNNCSFIFDLVSFDETLHEFNINSKKFVKLLYADILRYFNFTKDVSDFSSQILKPSDWILGLKRAKDRFIDSRLDLENLTI